MCEWNEQFEYEGKKFAVDSCIAPLIKALNDVGIKTVASCCGHGKRPGNIALKDGRELEILPDKETWDKVQEAYKQAGLFEPIND